MPLYDLTCKNCGHTFEALLKIHEDPEGVSCPRCGRKGARKVPGRFQTNDWSRFLDHLERRVNPEKFR
ncbi:MAG TPA: zinc ribbon domain-containing protein [Syntrophales bacterium]|nr:zinc ribbon domain-containing protein [Syntrophales bacterium]HOL60210.1 zinc ribbon domain-containing protein [Syntrophales bacterium]HPO36350.1 zinc ribbon domain-containing protein [Syntrophales bacterium]